MINHIWFVRLCGVKGEKMTDNDKKLCPLHSMSQEPYIIWLSFLVHICKMVISPSVFFFVIFSKFWFCWLFVGWKGNEWPKMTKYYVCLTPCLRNHTSYDCDFWFTWVKWWYLQPSFFICSKFWFFGALALYYRNCRSCHQGFWYTGVT